MSRMGKVELHSWGPGRAEIILRRRKWMVGAVWLGVILLMGSMLLDHVRASNRFRDDWSAFDGRRVEFVSAPSSEVINVRIDKNSAPVPVRLMGVASFNSSWDAKVIEVLNASLKGQWLTLRLEQTQTRDGEGRLMAFVFMEDDQPVAADLARRGMVLADRRVAYHFHGTVEQAEGEAHRRRNGLWATATSAMLPPWRTQWFRQQVNLPVR